jgi:hypothetical protein
MKARKPIAQEVRGLRLRAQLWLGQLVKASPTGLFQPLLLLIAV